MHRTTTRPRMSEAEIETIVDQLADVARALHEADPDRQHADKPDQGHPAHAGR
jgi:hypothetical protein